MRSEPSQTLITIPDAQTVLLWILWVTVFNTDKCLSVFH